MEEKNVQVKCDWKACEAMGVYELASFGKLLIPDGWIHHDYHDLCPEHATPFRAREWIKVREGRWTPTWDEKITCLLELQDEFGTHLFLEEHPGGLFVIGFGGRPSCADLMRSNDRAALEALLKDDEGIHRAWERGE
jgi:hypothetical protein